MATLTQIDAQALLAFTAALNESLGEGKWTQRTEQDANGTKLIVSTREQPPREWSTRISSSSEPEQQRSTLQAFASQVKAGASQPAGVQLPPDVQATGGQQAPRPAEDTSSSSAPSVDAASTAGQQAPAPTEPAADATSPSSAAESRADTGAADADAASSSSSTEQTRRRR